MAINVEPLVESITSLGGRTLGNRARPVLEAASPSAAMVDKATAFLKEAEAMAHDYGLSLPIARYDEAFFSKVVEPITQAGYQLGFMTQTVPGEINPIIGISWMSPMGSGGLAVIQIADTHDSLASLFTDIANAIRDKTGSDETMRADLFPNYIREIQ